MSEPGGGVVSGSGVGPPWLFGSEPGRGVVGGSGGLNSTGNLAGGSVI